jgi:hypothetical protein
VVGYDPAGGSTGRASDERLTPTGSGTRLQVPVDRSEGHACGTRLRTCRIIAPLVIVHFKFLSTHLNKIRVKCSTRTAELLRRNQSGVRMHPSERQVQ